MTHDLKVKLAVRAFFASVGLVIGVIIGGDEVAGRCMFGVGGILLYWFTCCVFPGFASDPEAQRIGKAKQ